MRTGFLRGFDGPEQGDSFQVGHSLTLPKIGRAAIQDFTLAGHVILFRPDQGLAVGDNGGFDGCDAFFRQARLFRNRVPIPAPVLVAKAKVAFKRDGWKVISNRHLDQILRHFPLAVHGGKDIGPPGIHRSRTMNAQSAEEWYPTTPGEAMMAGLTSYFLNAPPMPPVRINGQWYSSEEIYGPMPPTEVQVPLRLQELFLGSLGLPSPPMSTAAALAPAVATPLAPTKPGVSGMKNPTGTFGMAYWTHPNGFNYRVPPDGLGFGGRITLDNQFTSRVQADPVPDFRQAAQRFSSAMTGAGWEEKFHRFDTSLTANDLIRNDLPGYSGSNLFN